MYRKENLYLKAILLRSKGFSYNEILKYVPVAKSTISRWCHKIPLTEKQKARLIRKKKNNPFIQGLKKGASRSKKEARVWAKKQINKLLDSGEE